jgi:hypothetical protein
MVRVRAGKAVFEGMGGGIMDGTPEGLTDESPLDNVNEFDGIVGLPLEPDEGRPPGSSYDSQVYVSLSGDAESATWAIGLEDDLRVLALAFAAGGTALAQEITAGLLPESSGRSRSLDQPEEVDVALHGLMLDSRDEEKLRDLIRMLVAERIAGEGRRP